MVGTRKPRRQVGVGRKPVCARQQAGSLASLQEATVAAVALVAVSAGLVMLRRGKWAEAALQTFHPPH
jgi:hypothetical protein